MERDFLGLRKDSVVVVKEEAVEGCKDSEFSKGSGFPWPLSNTVSALPHFMSFKVAQEEKTAKIMSDSVASPGFMLVSAPDAFDTNQKCFSGEIQHDVHSVHFSHDVKMFPAANQPISVSMGNPFFKTQFVGAGQNSAGTTIKQQLVGGIPVTSPHSVSSPGAVAGTTEPWFSPKPTGGPAQLTIFYAGTVNVYNEISPEKAQAIMFLAGNGSSTSQPTAQVQVAPTSKLARGEGLLMNQTMNTPPCSALSSPISVSSHPVSRLGSGLVTNDEVLPVKPIAVAVNPAKKVDPPRIVSSVGPRTATTMMPSAVPQARKASLVRFLEKRKERVMNSAPYDISKKSPEFTSSGMDGTTFSTTSGVGTGSLSTNNDGSRGI